MYYSDDILEEVRSRNDIVDVISEYGVGLKKRGVTYFGLCPFHNEKTASFSVTPSKQIYYCFGCGEGGNVISFVMKYDNDTFPEAVQKLAQRAGITLPQPVYGNEEYRKKEIRAQLLEMYKLAAVFYHRQLKSEAGTRGRNYLLGRGLKEETIIRYGLGYADKTGTGLYRYLKEKKYSDEVMKESGLFTFTEKGVYDKFWNRVMFPIMDVNSRVIAFGGRVMGEGEPKYLNSPETRIFEKSRNLYGMHIAKSSRKHYFIICEGYMDVIALHCAGFTNAVAALGTAFTPQHGFTIKRYVKEVVLSFDSDGAGQKAALRAIPILKSAGLSVKVLDMSPYKDPDEFIQHMGAEAYEKRILEAENQFIFRIRMLQKNLDMSKEEEQTEFYTMTAEYLLEFEDPLEREVYTNSVSKKFGIPLDQLTESVKKRAMNYHGPKQKEEEGETQKRRKKTQESGFQVAQRILLTWLIEDTSIYGKICSYISPEDFIEPLYHQVAGLLFEQLRQKKVMPAEIINHFTDEKEHSAVAALFNTSLHEDMTPKEREKALNDTVKLIKDHSMQHKIGATTDLTEVMKLTQEKEKIKRIHINLDMI